MGMMDIEELRKKKKAELISIVEKLDSENLQLGSEIRFERAKAEALSKLSASSSVEEYFHSILFGFPIKATSALRLVLADKDLFGKSVTDGIGLNQEEFGYLDDQVSDQLGGKSVLVIEDTSRVHNLLFLPDKIYPKSIYAFPIIFSEQKVGFIWAADKEINAYNNQDLSRMKRIVGEFEWALGFLVVHLKNIQAESVFNAALNAIDNPVLLCDDSGEIVFHNQSAQREFSIHQTERVHGSTVTNLIELLKELPKNINLQFNDLQFEGSKLVVSVPNHGDHYLYYFINNTQEKLRGRYLAAIIDTITADINRGLEAIEGYTSLVSVLGELSPKQIEYIEGIAEESNRISKITNGLLNLNRMNSEGFLTIKSVSITELMQELAQKFQPVLMQKQLKINLDLGSDPVCIETDADMVEQLLLNLLESATQDAKMGSEISVTLAKNETDIAIGIQEKSAGLSKPDIEAIFLEQAGVADSRKNLYNARIIAKLLLGKIEIESQLGEGKKVNITLKQNI
jgi:signal transduction histidine kinase